MNTRIFKIRDHGRNGTVEVHADRLVRSLKKALGRSDTQMIPLRSVSSVEHDRKAIGTDVVKVHAGLVTYEWKVSKADEFAAALNEAIMAAGASS